MSFTDAILQDDVPLVGTREGDISDTHLAAARATGSAALDTETTGLDPHADRLRIVQVDVPGRGVEIVRVTDTDAANLRTLLADQGVVTLFHHAAFDLRFLRATFNVAPTSVRCTKIAAKLLYPQQKARQTLAALAAQYLGVQLDKTQRLSDWSRVDLTTEQLRYATDDVRHLHDLLDKLCDHLTDRGLMPLAKACWAHLPTRLELDHHSYGDVFTY